MSTSLISASACDLPDELLELVLHRVPPLDLVRKCQLVCKRWNKILASHRFWRRHLQRYGYRLPVSASECRWRPWSSLAAEAVTPTPWGTNLIRNCCGEEVDEVEMEMQERRTENDGLMDPWPRYPHWQILGSAGEGWKVKGGSGTIEQEAEQRLVCSDQTHCHHLHLRRRYVASNYSCCKQQSIVIVGPRPVLGAKLLDEFLPLELEVGASVCSTSDDPRDPPVYQIAVVGEMRALFRFTDLGPGPKLVRASVPLLRQTTRHIVFEHGGLNVAINGIYAVLKVKKVGTI